QSINGDLLFLPTIIEIGFIRPFGLIGNSFTAMSVPTNRTTVQGAPVEILRFINRARSVRRESRSGTVPSQSWDGSHPKELERQAQQSLGAFAVYPVC